jgi:small subunit ribosomal protein S6
MKLPLVEVVRDYELTYLLPATYTDSELGKLVDEVETLIKKNKGTVKGTEKWGKRKLAYKIKHSGAYQTEAHYFQVIFTAPSVLAPEIEKAIYLYTKIIRHLMIVADEANDKK